MLLEICGLVWEFDKLLLLMYKECPVFNYSNLFAGSNCVLFAYFAVKRACSCGVEKPTD
jgi:hypothetical protein